MIIFYLNNYEMLGICYHIMSTGSTEHELTAEAVDALIPQLSLSRSHHFLIFPLSPSS